MNRQIRNLKPLPLQPGQGVEHGVVLNGVGDDVLFALLRGHVPVDVEADNIDMLSLSGHKFHAPKGAGALYCRMVSEMMCFLPFSAPRRAASVMAQLSDSVPLPVK